MCLINMLTKRLDLGNNRSSSVKRDLNEPHVSRSQAKRLLMGLEKFNTIILDFKGVVSVGQAFVDQVFRVSK